MFFHRQLYTQNALSLYTLTAHITRFAFEEIYLILSNTFYSTYIFHIYKQSKIACFCKKKNAVEAREKLLDAHGEEKRPILRTWFGFPLSEKPAEIK